MRCRQRRVSATVFGRSWLLLTTQVLLLLLVLPPLCHGDDSIAGHDCPPKFVSKSGCREDGIQTVVVTHYEWNTYLKRCQKKIQLNENPCDKTKSVKGVCPEPRTVEPGECNPKSGMQKTLVIHYEPDGRGRCVMHKDYAYPKCPDKLQSTNSDCPEPRYFQKPCAGKHRQVFKFYYEKKKGKNDCVEKTSISMEACGAFVPAKECPKPAIAEKGQCKNGFRTVIRTEYNRDPAGKCAGKSRYVTQACDGSENSSEASKCPPNLVKHGSCSSGLQSVTKQYFERTKDGRCIRKFTIENKPCGSYKSGVCPSPRVLEPGPCVDGTTKVLVAHFEPDPATGKCRERRSFTSKTCGKALDSPGGSAGGGTKSGSESDDRCPQTTYSQGPCSKGYRTLYTFTYRYSEPLKRCMKHAALKKEQCAALVINEDCPSEDTLEKGPCQDGFQTSIVYHYSRSSEGKCAKSVKRVTSPCQSKGKTDCPAKSEKKSGSCQEGIQRLTIVYYEFSHLKKRCVRKFQAKEVACSSDRGGHGSAAPGSAEDAMDNENGSTSIIDGGGKGKKCPTPRIVEPGPCKNGQQLLMIEHHELDRNQGKCILKKDFVHKPCGAPTKRQVEAEKHNCPGSTYHQKPCRKDGYRSVIKYYYRFSEVKGRCVKNVKVDDEKCSRLVATLESCEADQMVEEGPCSNGFRVDIVYRFSRNSSGSCERQEKRVTVSCVAKRVVP